MLPCCAPNADRCLCHSAQGRGGSTGYDNAVALPARADSEELAKENNKSTAALKGQAVFSVAKVGFIAVSQHRQGRLSVSLYDTSP
jgi:hypothetical protein